MKSFDAPQSALGEASADTLATLIGTVADIALIVDPRGIIQDFAYGDDELGNELGDDLVGRAWTELATADSRSKIEALLGQSETNGRPRWHQIDHLSRTGHEIPVRYFTLPLEGRDFLIAAGRSQQGIASLQQRLVDAQQSLERDYWRLRQLETRYRLLFRSASDAILVLDPDNGKVVEANAAATLILTGDSRRLIGRPLPDAFEAQSLRALQSLIASIRAGGRSNEIQLRLKSGTELSASAAQVRQESLSLIMLRLTPTHAAEDRPSEPGSRLGKLVERAPDAIVLTSNDGRILSANHAFLELAQANSESQVKGESLDRWLGRPGVDLNVLVANLRQHGAVRLFATHIRPELGPPSEVEISAVAVLTEDQPNFGFIIRNIDRRVGSDVGSEAALPRSIEHLTELVGRVPLKEVVRESTDMIERLCIEAALELTGDNRASAAELLGLSRQSLYVKLRRYGLGEAGADEDD